MDFLFGGGGGQASSLAGATAIAAVSAAAAAAASLVTSPVSAAAARAPESASRAHYASESDHDTTTATTEALHQAFVQQQAFVHQHHFNGHDNGPILYTDSNRTSAIDDIRSVVIYIFIITIFLCFFLILPGIRNEKLPTFFCITTSLLVGSIIIVSLFGTSWHVGEAPISAAYKAFSRDRIQGDLSVRMGLQSVNISLKAHKYYILHATDGPMIMENVPAAHMLMSSAASSHVKQPSESFNNNNNNNNKQDSQASKLAEDTELESEELFAASTAADLPAAAQAKPRRATRSSAAGESFKNQTTTTATTTTTRDNQQSPSSLFQKYTIKRVHVDINYNERFYWIGPMQMRQEYHQALERGLPYPILTVVEYLSQDDAGFNWSRQYRAAGYYTSMCLWLSASVCVLMFCLHCAAPKYGIYAMQILGTLLLFTNLTYATLVPRGDHKLVIPFQGQSLAFRFGWNFWAVLIGGCLSLLVGTIIVIIDNLFPNFIFTTILDADFDSPHQNYYQRKHKILGRPAAIGHGGEGDDFESADDRSSSSGVVVAQKKPKLPPFMRESELKKRTAKSRNSTIKLSSSSNRNANSIHSRAIDDEYKLSQQQSKADDDTNISNRSNTSENKRLSSDESLRKIRQTTTTTTIYDGDVDQERRGQAVSRTSSIDKRDIESRGTTRREKESDSQHTIRL